MVMGVVLVVVFFLAPWTAYHSGSKAYWSLFGFPIDFFSHFLIPCGALLSYLVFEEPFPSRYSLRYRSLPSILPILLYSIIVSSLATNHFLSPEEKFNNVYGVMDLAANPWWVSLITGLTVLITTYFEGVVLLLGQQKVARKRTLQALPTRAQ